MVSSNSPHKAVAKLQLRHGGTAASLHLTYPRRRDVGWHLSVRPHRPRRTVRVRPCLVQAHERAMRNTPPAPILRYRPGLLPRIGSVRGTLAQLSTERSPAFVREL